MKKLLLLCFICCAHTLLAQNTETPPDTTTYVVTTYDGREYIGQILSDDGREILINTSAKGKIYLKKENIKLIVKADQKKIVNDVYYGEGPFTTRYIFTNNALPIRKGENYAMWNLYGPEVHFAVTPRLNFGIMTTWIMSPIAAAAKYTFATDDRKGVYFSAGTIVGSSGWMFNGRGAGGLHWLSATVGDRMKNLSVSAGWGWVKTGRELYKEGTYIIQDEAYYNSSTSKIPLTNGNFTHSAVLSVAGIIQLGSNVSFVMDNLITFPRVLDNNLSRMTVDPGGYDPITGAYNPATYQYTVTNTRSNFIYYMAMPGMRFQKSDAKAFQFCMAIVRFKNDSNEAITFPFPMLSWFQKF